MVINRNTASAPMLHLSDTEENLKSLLKILLEIEVDYLCIDILNPRPKVWASISKMLLQHFPSLVPEYRRILYNPVIREAYSNALRARATQVARQHSLDDCLRFCF